MEFEDFPYEGYVSNRSKHIPNDSYLYLSRQIAKFMMRFNMRFFPVIMQMTNTQKMNNSDIITQNITNLHVCSLYESKSKWINADEIELHICSTDEKN